jgi:hypothetical protein
MVSLRRREWIHRESNDNFVIDTVSMMSAEAQAFLLGLRQFTLHRTGPARGLRW